jgi:hypothetical protein
MPPVNRRIIEMASKEYKWIQTWCIQDDPNVLVPGEVVTVVNGKGESKEVMVLNVFPFTTKSGKELERATVQDV